MVCLGHEVCDDSAQSPYEGCLPGRCKAAHARWTACRSSLACDPSAAWKSQWKEISYKLIRTRTGASYLQPVLPEQNTDTKHAGGPHLRQLHLASMI